jgi:hypothetical protein
VAAKTKEKGGRGEGERKGEKEGGGEKRERKM